MTPAPRLTLQQFAWATAQQDAGVARSEVLAALGLDLAAWQQEQYTWLTMFAARIKEHHFELWQRYSHEYMRIRGAPPAPPKPVMPSMPPASIPNDASRIPSARPTAPVLSEPAPVVPVAAPVAAPRVTEPKLSLHEFAMLRAELDVCPEQAARIFAKYDLSDPSQRELELELWQRRLHTAGKDLSEFRSAYTSAQLHFRNLLRR